MRGLKKRITGGMLALVMSSALVLNVNAVTLDEAQQKADELEQQKEAAEAEKDSLTEQLGRHHYQHERDPGEADGERG